MPLAAVRRQVTRRYLTRAEREWTDDVLGEVRRCPRCYEVWPVTPEIDGDGRLVQFWYGPGQWGCRACNTEMTYARRTRKPAEIAQERAGAAERPATVQ
jgi:hypothetical protein